MQKSVETLSHLRQKRCLQKLFLRTQLTTATRFNVQTMVKNHTYRLKRSIFDQILSRLRIRQSLVYKLSHLEYFMRSKVYVDCF